MPELGLAEDCDSSFLVVLSSLDLCSSCLFPDFLFRARQFNEVLVLFHIEEKQIQESRNQVSCRMDCGMQCRVNEIISYRPYNIMREV